MVNLIVGCAVSFLVGAMAAYIYKDVTGKMK